MEIRKSGDLPIEKRSGVIPQITSNWSQPIIMERIHIPGSHLTLGVFFCYAVITPFYLFCVNGLF